MRKNFGSGPFDSIPARLRLSDEGFKSAFAVYALAEKEAGRTTSIAQLAAAVDASERVLRGARSGDKTLPAYQVELLAKLMGCGIDDIAENPYAAWRAEDRARELAEMKAWPVPLREVTSWKGFTANLVKCRTLDFDHEENTVDLTTAASLQAAMDLMRSATERAKVAPVLLEAGLKDTAADLARHGLRILGGRYVGRHRYGTDRPDLTGVGLHLAIVVRIRREAEDSRFAIDRSHEPLMLSDIEDHCVDDLAVQEEWLEWEGKRRLALWPVEDSGSEPA